METKRIKITAEDKDKFLFVAKAIRDGKLVAFPTETVYGLGADGLNEQAVKKIFEVKGRPQDNPLILHICKMDMLEKLGEVTDDIRRLADAFWPGPLTMVLQKKEVVPSVITAGGDTVAVRMPAHPIALQLIERANTPIAAPSANISGRPSPTNAGDVFEDLNGKISYILDAGSSDIGIESTVIDMTDKPYTILRPGFLTAEDFEPFIGKVLYDKALTHKGEIARSPGQKYKHYAPKAKVIAFVGNSKEKFKEMNQLISSHKKVGVIAFEEHRKYFSDVKELLTMGSIHEPTEMAHDLFFYLREMDRKKVDLILMEGIEEKGIGIGIMNRLRKSTAGDIRIYK